MQSTEMLAAHLLPVEMTRKCRGVFLSLLVSKISAKKLNICAIKFFVKYTLNPHNGMKANLQKIVISYAYDTLTF